MSNTDLYGRWYRSPRDQRRDAIEAILGPVHEEDTISQLRLATIHDAEIYRTFTNSGAAMRDFLGNVIELLKGQNE